MRQSGASSVRAADRHGIAGFFQSIGSFFAGFVNDVRTGDVWVRLSLLVCGAGYFGRKQYVKGVIVTLVQAALLIGFPLLLWPYLAKIGTLGTVQQEKVFNMETMKNEYNDYDNSFKILLFGIIALLVIAVAIVLYIRNIHNVRELQARAESGKHVNRFGEDVGEALNGKFHTTLLTLPTLGIIVTTITPLIVMICIAFTNYDINHIVPTKLFTWVGLDNFKKLFTNSLSLTFSYAFGKVLVWTLVWSFFATFTNYFGGILLAMFINNKRTRGKRFWRTCFMVAIAVPQFVSLMLIRNFFSNTGIVNTICANIGVLDLCKQMGLVSPGMSYIPFLSDASWSKVMIILINMWIGMPYMMLISTGVLMNIPADLLESAKIDGASKFQSFKSITMPYVSFVLGPYMVSSFVNNINNFNVIYLLQQDVFTTSDQALANSNAKETDLLVTWLYRLTQDYSNYKMASAIGILIFIICAAFTLVAFRSLTRGDKEENFQ